jgi:hypothetical protein
MLVTLSEVMTFCRVESLHFNITGANNVLYFKYTAGTATAITLTPGLYNSTTLAAHIVSLLKTVFTDSNITMTFSSTTLKFTITMVTGGKTIQFISSNSTGGFRIGFTADSLAAAAITSDTAIIDDSALLSQITIYCDKFIKSYLNRNIESTAYTGIYYSANRVISVDDYPIISLSVISGGKEDAILLTCTSEYSWIKYDGTTFTFSTGDTVLKSSLTLVSDLVSAINLITGFTATSNSAIIAARSINTILPFNLVKAGQYSIKTYGEMLSDYYIDEDSGIIKTSCSELYLEFTAGYATIPDDLKLGVLLFISGIYSRIIEESIDLRILEIDDIRKTYAVLTKEALNYINPYRRLLT